MNAARKGPRAEKRTTPADRAGDVLRDCDCPACTGEDVDPAELLGALLADVSAFADTDDPLDAELAGAMFLTTAAASDDDVLPMLLEAVVPAIESRSDPNALTVLRALASATVGVEPELAAATSAAADRMAATGVPEPTWTAELAEPVHLTECARLQGDDVPFSVLLASFRRAGRGHTLTILVDELPGASATDIGLLDVDRLSTASDAICADARTEGVVLRSRPLDPAEFRWYAEEALDARAEEDPLGEASYIDDDEDDDGPPYPVLARLARVRLAVLPEARRPAGARRRPTSRPPALSALDLLMGGAPGGLRGAAAVKLPTKRKTKDGPAPVYQIKVGLRGTKPPIWRRLEVPGDLGLAALHDVIQVAFGWDDGHMHVFETPYGDFGRADRELGHRAEAPVTLEQVAPRATDKIRYTYDFGDDWEHEILVEKVVDRDQAGPVHPRCTGGRRAAPPEDCGGVWGYADLVEILADSRHPDHQERLEWLGLDDPSGFDPAAFDPEAVNRALAQIRRPPRKR